MWIDSGDAQQTASGIYNHLGTIEVVVLRCHANPKAPPVGRYSISPDTSNYSNTDMSERLIEVTPTGSPTEQHQPQSSSSSSSAEGSVVGLGIFDGACDEANNSVKYGVYPSEMPMGLDGNWDDPHPPGPDGRRRKEWTWSVKGNEGVYHRIGEQPFQSEEPRGRIGERRSHRPPSSPHFGQDWESEARRDERSRDRRSWRQSPSRRSDRHHNPSPRGRPPSHRSSASTAPLRSHRGSHASNNDITTTWGGVPATGVAPAIVIQVQQTPPVAASVHSHDRSRSRERKPSSGTSSWPSPPPRSIDSWATRNTLLTPSEIEQQEIRWGVRPSKASHASCRVSDRGGVGDHSGNRDPSPVQSHRYSRSHPSSKRTSHRRSGNDSAGHKPNNTSNGGGTGWGGDKGANNGQSWGATNSNNNSGNNNGWGGNNEGGNASGGGWASGNGGNGDNAGSGQAWSGGGGSNALQKMPGSWEGSPTQVNNDSWGGGEPNDQQASGWAHSSNDNANNNASGAWGGGQYTNSGGNQGNSSGWNQAPTGDNGGNNNDASWDNNGNNNNNWNSGNPTANAWEQKPSSNSGNNDWNTGNNGNNNDNGGSGKNSWEQKPGSQADNDNWNTSSNNQDAGTTWTAATNNPTADWADDLRKIFAKGNDQTTGSKPEAAPQQQTSPVHGFYSVPNSPIPPPQGSPLQPVPLHKASPPHSQQGSLRDQPANAAKATFATIKPYWAKWHDTQTLKADEPAIEEPSFTVTEDFVKETSTFHQIKPGKPHVYSHRIHRPVYIDKHEEPYAVFVFKYRPKGTTYSLSFDTLVKERSLTSVVEVIEQILGSPLSDGFDDVKSRLSSLSKEELVEELVKAKVGSCGIGYLIEVLSAYISLFHRLHRLVTRVHLLSSNPSQPPKRSTAGSTPSKPRL